MRRLITILLLLWTSCLVYGQAYTTIASYNSNFLLRLYGAPAQDTAFLGDVGTLAWDTSLVSRAEQSRLITQLSEAYTQNAQVNPYFTTLASNIFAGEKVIYCWFNPVVGRYDSLCLYFKDATPAGRAIYFLTSNLAWQQLPTDTFTTTGNVHYFLAKITQPGFYALFEPRAQSFSPGDYFSSYPNPFNPVLDEVCRLCYFLETNAEVTVRIFTKTGDEVFAHAYRRGENGGLGSTAGLYLNTVIWDGRNKQGRLVDSGGYLCQIAVKDKYTRIWKIGVRR